MRRNSITIIVGALKATRDRIKKMFRKLNAAASRVPAQPDREKAGTDLAVLLNELLASEFFTESVSFTKEQRKGGTARNCLIQAMMLLDRKYITGFEMQNFSETGVTAYVESIRGRCSDKQCVLLRSAVQYLTDVFDAFPAFPEKEKGLMELHIPLLLYFADVAEDEEISPLLFRLWWEFFRSEDILYESYRRESCRRFCDNGSTALEKVNGRLSIMVKSFCNYHEIEIPEELEGMAEDATGPR